MNHKEEVLKNLDIGMFAALSSQTPDPYVEEVDAEYNIIDGEPPDGETAEGNVNRKMFKELTIEEAKIEDVDKAYEIDEEAFSSPHDKRAFDRAIYTSQFDLIVAKKENNVVAFSLMKLDENPPSLSAIAVSEDYRGNGFGKLLLEESENHLAEKGFSKMELRVRKGNDTAIGLYEDNGFEKTGTIEGYYSDGDTAIVMSTSLKSDMYDLSEEERKEAVLQSVAKSVQKAIEGENNSEDSFKEEVSKALAKRVLEKKRVYVDSPDEVPEEFEVQEGEQGGIYYETDETTEELTQEEWEQLGLEILDDFDEDDYRWDYWEGVDVEEVEEGSIVHINDSQWSGPGETEGPRGVVVEADVDEGQFAVVTESGDMVLAEDYDSLIQGEAEFGLTAIWDSPDKDNIRVGWDDSQAEEERERERQEQIQSGERAPHWASEDPLENVTESDVPEDGLIEGELYHHDGDIVELEEDESYEGDVQVFDVDPFRYSAVGGVLCRAGNPIDIQTGEPQYFDFAEEAGLSDGWYQVADDMEEEGEAEFPWILWNEEEGLVEIPADEARDMLHGVHRPRENSYNMPDLDSTPEPSGSRDPDDWSIDWGETDEAKTGTVLPMAQKKLLMREWKSAVDTDAAESVSDTIRSVKDYTYDTHGQKYDKLIKSVMGVEGEVRSGDFEDAEEPTEEEVEAMRVLQEASQKFFETHYGEEADIHRGLADYSHENLLPAIGEAFVEGEELSGRELELNDNPSGVWTTQKSAARTFTVVGGTSKSLMVNDRTSKDEIFNMPDAIYPYEEREERAAEDSDWDEGEVNIPSHGRKFNADEIMVVNAMEEDVPSAPLSQVVDNPLSVMENGNAGAISRFVKTLSELAPEKFYDSYVDRLQSDEEITSHEDYEKIEEQIQSIEYDPSESILFDSATMKANDPIIIDVKNPKESNWLNATADYMEEQEKSPDVKETSFEKVVDNADTSEANTGTEVLEIRDYYRVWVKSPDSVPEGQNVMYDSQGDPAGNHYYYEVPLETKTRVDIGEKAIENPMAVKEKEADVKYPTREELREAKVPQKDLDLIDRTKAEISAGRAVFSEKIYKANPKVFKQIGSALSLLHLYKAFYDQGEEYSTYLNQIQKELGRRGIYSFEKVAKARRYVDNPNEAPEGVSIEEGPQGGLYYETEGADEGEEGTTESEVQTMVDDMAIDEWPDEHSILSEEELRNETGRILDRYDESVAKTTLNHLTGLKNQSKQASFRFGERDIVFRPDTQTETLAHEFGHATLGSYGFTVNDIGNMLAHFYAGKVPEIDFGDDVGEVAESLVEDRLNNPKIPEERKEETREALEDVKERYSGLEFQREDMHVFIPDDWEGEIPQEKMRDLANAVNNAWDKMIDASKGEDVDAKDYIIGKPYSGTNAHETMAMTHEVMQGDVADPNAMENLYLRQQELLNAYTKIFDPADTQKDMLNELFKNFGPNKVWNEVPYPEVEGLLQE